MPPKNHGLVLTNGHCKYNVYYRSVENDGNFVAQKVVVLESKESKIIFTLSSKIQDSSCSISNSSKIQELIKTTSQFQARSENQRYKISITSSSAESA